MVKINDSAVQSARQNIAENGIFAFPKIEPQTKRKLKKLGLARLTLMAFAGSSFIWLLVSLFNVLLGNSQQEQALNTAMAIASFFVWFGTGLCFYWRKDDTLIWMTSAQPEDSHPDDTEDQEKKAQTEQKYAAYEKRLEDYAEEQKSNCG